MKKMSYAMGFLILLACGASSAQSISGVVGLRLNSAKVSGATTKDQFGFQAGALYVMPISDVIGFRTGGMLAMLDSKVESSGTSGTLKHLRILAPLTLTFGNETVKGYFGTNLALKLTSSCEISSSGSCTIFDENNFVIQPILGADFVLTAGTTLGAFYEFESEFVKNWKQSAFGVNLGFSF